MQNPPFSMHLGKSKVASFDSDMMEYGYYADACRWEPENINSLLKRNTSATFVALGRDGNIRSISVESMGEVINSLLNPIGEVDELILQLDNNKLNRYADLFDLVKTYSENSFQTLKFCNDLKKCVSDSRDNQFDIQVAFQEFENFKGEGDFERYEGILEALKKYTAAGNPFTEDFSKSLKCVYESQILLLKKSQAMKAKLDKKFKKNKALRTVTNAILVVTCASVLVCSVLVTAIVSPPAVVAAAIAAAAALPFGVGEWVNSLWDKYEKELKGKNDITNILDAWAYIGKFDMENIQVFVTKCEDEINSILRNADRAIEKEAAVILALEEMKGKLTVVGETMGKLIKHIDNCIDHLNTGREKILEKIVETQKK